MTPPAVVPETDDADPPARPDGFPGERRWPMALAVLVIVALTVALPESLKLLPVWALPPVELGLLLALVLGDPGKIDRTARSLRVVSVALISLVALDALACTAFLVEQLVTGGDAAETAETLLLCGWAVWLNAVLAFSLIYWELDGGGAAARFHAPSRAFDFAYPQQLNPEVAPPGWRPQYPDYLYVAFTAATALSPTDAMPLTVRAKFAMALQAAASILLGGLVIARAVNLFAS